MTAVRVIAVVCAGLVAGILLRDRAGATYARPELTASSFIQFQQIVHIHFVRMMPLLYVTAILAGLIWLLARPRWRGVEFWMVAFAIGAVLFCAILTRSVNVPVNEQLMTWKSAAPPANVRELWAPWERAHTIRTIVAIGAFVLEVTALSLAASGAPAARGTGQPEFHGELRGP